jgi:hypothetical protein
LANKKIARFVENHRDCRDCFPTPNGMIEGGGLGVIRRNYFVEGIPQANFLGTIKVGRKQIPTLS